ncbi:hypothetical protein [Patiriisocius sp. Uisw_017]|jgi:hypothetical protein|uniref:hypothetical protein n=1 Tax=Patiriisocius sp. Uisw_017 TaxID=3230968 RepID=UPI0039EB1D93
MKNFILSIFTLLLLSFCIENVNAQEITKYDFLEVIIVQKANNRGKVKRIRVEEQEALVGKTITIEQMEDLDTTAQLLNYMNTNNWEFIDRQAIVSDDNDPVWMSYIFRKLK